MKVAIIGTAGGREGGLAHFGQPDWEVWGLNDSWLFMRGDDGQLRADRWFELHPNTALTRARRPAAHWDEIARMTIPVYYFGAQPPETVNPVRFPLQAAIDAGTNYFASTLAYQVALALSEHATTIALYGTPLLGAREALEERPCLEYWLGLADGRGVEVIVDHDYPRGLLRHPLRYALDDRAERYWTYQVVRAHRAYVRAWLRSEEVRLGLPWWMPRAWAESSPGTWKRTCHDRYVSK